jgi:hypothetical protein
MPLLLQGGGGRTGIELATKLGAMQHQGAQNDLYAAQAGRWNEVANTERTQREAAAKAGALMDVNNPTWRAQEPNIPPVPGDAFLPGAPRTGLSQPDATFLDDAAAIKAVQDASARGEPYTAGVPNKGTLSSLAMQMDPAIGRAVLGQMQGPKPMTEYQRAMVPVAQQNAETRAGQLDARLSQPGRTRQVVGVDAKGNQVIHTVDAETGSIINSVASGTQAPSVLNNANVRERDLAKSLDVLKKPHLDVLNAYQRYEEIRGTGDNSQANQFLAQQLMKMATTGQRAIPKAELERILGSGDLGNDWMGRAANMITQMASGVRTPTIDKRLNDIADAMARSSADRIGQEIRNVRARSPEGVDPDRVVGNKPTIYGRFIITPSGKVHAFSSSQEAQARLDEAAQKIGQ